MLNAIPEIIDQGLQKNEEYATALIEILGDNVLSYIEHKEDVQAFYRDTQNEAHKIFTEINGLLDDYYKCIAENGLEDKEEWESRLSDIYDVWTNQFQVYNVKCDSPYDKVDDKIEDILYEIPEGHSFSEYADESSFYIDDSFDNWDKMSSISFQYSNIYYAKHTAISNAFKNNETDVDKVFEELFKDSQEEQEEETEEVEVEEKEEVVNNSTGLRPEFKEFMDQYETFYTEYSNLLMQSAVDPSNVGILGQLSSYFGKEDQMDAEFEAWKDKNLNADELQYYQEVRSRVDQMMGN